MPHSFVWRWCPRSCTCSDGGTGGRPSPWPSCTSGSASVSPRTIPRRSQKRRRPSPPHLDEAATRAPRVWRTTPRRDSRRDHRSAAGNRSRQRGVDPVGGTTVGVTPPSIYLHFTDKDALLDAVCAQYFEKLDEEMQRAAMDQPSSIEVLRAQGLAY